MGMFSKALKPLFGKEGTGEILFSELLSPHTRVDLAHAQKANPPQSPFAKGGCNLAPADPIQKYILDKSVPTGFYSTVNRFHHFNGSDDVTEWPGFVEREAFISTGRTK